MAVIGGIDNSSKDPVADQPEEKPTSNTDESPKADKPADKPKEEPEKDTKEKV